MKELNYDLKRQALVHYLESTAGITDTNILKAFSKVPRHLFVPPEVRDLAYEDTALPIGCGQTISQPSLLAYILEKLNLSSQDTVLEIGSGSGYLVALLSQLVKNIYAIEIIGELVERSSALLKTLNYLNVHMKCGDGTYGWPEIAQFDAMIFSAHASSIPLEIFAQLKNNGRLIAPIGEIDSARLNLYTLNNSTITTNHLIPVRFVPLISISS